jgi:chromosome condensin MukBEF complex kleisin-like MukF subunit
MNHLKVKKIFAEYKRNENNNYHSENVVLLAEHFGTESDLMDAKAIQRKHDEIGHMPMSLMRERFELHQKLYPMLVNLNEQIKQKL